MPTIYFDKYKLKAALRVLSRESKENVWDSEILGLDYYAHITEEEIKERAREVIFDLLEEIVERINFREQE